MNPQHCTNNMSGIWREPWRSELLSSMRHPQMLNTSHSLGWEGDEQLHQSSEALPVHDRGAGLIILALGDPHLLEGAQRRQDGAADPDGVLALRRRHNLDLHRGRCESRDLLRHALTDAREHRSASGQHDVRVEVLADVHIALHDGLEGRVVDAAGLLADEARVEEHLGAAEALAANGDDVAVRQLVGLLLVRALRRSLHLAVEVEGDVGELLLDVADDLALCRGREGVAALGQDLHHVLREVAACKVKAQDGMGQRIAFVDRHGVRHAVARVHDDACGAAGGIQREHSLDGDIHGRHVEGLEHDLGHALSVGLGVEGSLGQEDGVLLRGNTQLVVEGVVPDLLHVVPVGHDAVLNGVLQGQNTSLGLSLITDVGVLLVHAHHDSRVLGSSNDGREHGSGSIITSETGLAHTGTVIHHQSLHVFSVGHFK
mmetsp:Transcript_62306/g.109769  ORF Transcript_62306/g.109769 Transcript_62306/m.109769 type:complete len:430 (-) Transcript_62306:38-1327(-)